MWRRPLLATLLIGCAPSRASAPPGEPAARAVTPSPTSSVKDTRRWRTLFLTGDDNVRDAAWVAGGGIAAITRNELWRLRPEAPEQLEVVPLARPAAEQPAMAVAFAEQLVALALDDGSIDVFRAGARLHTLAAAGLPFAGALRFSPDARTLAVGRFREVTVVTELVDVQSGRVRGTIAGARPIFDPSSSFVSTSSGLYGVDARVVASVPGARTDESAPSRGFFQQSAVFAVDRAVVWVDTESGASSRVATSCAPGLRMKEQLDVEHGRMISVCTDAVLVTDLASRRQKRIVLALAKQAAYDVLIAPAEGQTFLVQIPYNGLSRVDPVAGVAQAVPIDRQNVLGELLSSETRCVSHALFERGDCASPALRADGAFRMKIRNGLVVTARGQDKPVIDWSILLTHRTEPRWTGGAFEVTMNDGKQLLYRFGASPSTTPPAPARPCLGSAWETAEARDSFASYVRWQDRAEIACVCSSAQGCVEHPLAGRENTFVAASETGSWVEAGLGRITLHRPDGSQVHRTVPPECVRRGTFVSDDRLIVPCEQPRRAVRLLELSAQDLTELHGRPAPLEATRVELLRAGDDLLYVADFYAVRLPLEWLATGSDAPKAKYFLGQTFGAYQAANGAIEIVGDRAAALSQMRCFDGHSLHSLDTCH